MTAKVFELIFNHRSKPILDATFKDFAACHDQTHLVWTKTFDLQEGKMIFAEGLHTLNTGFFGYQWNYPCSTYSLVGGNLLIAMKCREHDILDLVDLEKDGCIDF